MKINAVYKILEDKPVYLSTGPKHWDKIPESNEQGYMFCHPMWFFGVKSIPLYWRLRRGLKSRNIKLLLLHNSRIEYLIGLLAGFDSYLLNQNMHADESEFIVRDDVAKRYDAVYVAAAARYKRIPLALKVKSLFVVTYFWPDIRDESGFWNLGIFDHRLNGVEHNKDRIERSEVGKKLNEAHCGLALSRVEGAMWAVQEYLLSGIPVVTTWNLGGRNRYLNKGNSVFVMANQTAVARGVKRAKSIAKSPQEIRSQVISEMKKERMRFVEFVQKRVGLSQNEIAILSNIWAEPGLNSIRVL